MGTAQSGLPIERCLIRRMQADDIDSVVEVEKKAFRTPWSRAAFEAEIVNNDLAYYLVLTMDGRVIGYAGMWLIVDEAHVTNIAVLPEYHGLALGEKLLRALIREAKFRGALSMTLEVRRSNIRAQKLYTRMGFLPRGIRPRYYADTQEDAIIMWLDEL